MKKVARISTCIMQLAAFTLLGAAACAGPTSSAPVPTVNGTYDRSMDPGASNASGGTTRTRQPAPPVTTSAEVVAPSP